MKFELTNLERPCFGLQIIKNDWKRIELSSKHIYYLDKEDKIRKVFYTLNNGVFREFDTNYQTKHNEIILPNTKREREKPINELNIISLKPNGLSFTSHLQHDDYNGKIIIEDERKKLIFYSTDFEGITIKNYNFLRKWVEEYVSNTDENDLKEIEKFRKTKGKRIKVKEGDVFSFKLDRKNYGFGRIMLNIREIYKNDKSLFLNKNFGLQYINSPILIKLYLIKSTNPNLSLSTILKAKSLPTDVITDYPFMKGQYPVIGNVPLKKQELDFPIVLGKFSSNGLVSGDIQTYIQWGWIFKTLKYEYWFNDYCQNYNDRNSLFSGSGTPYNLNGYISKEVLENCISKNSVNEYWKYFTTSVEAAKSSKIEFRSFDLRNPLHYKEKEQIFKYFGLDVNKDYYENHEIFLKKK